MKLPLLCVFMGLALVFGDQFPHKKSFTRIGVQKRGESYNEYIESYVQQARDSVSGDNLITQEAVGKATDYILDCLPKYTNDAVSDRRQNMLFCVVESVSRRNRIGLSKFDSLTQR